MCISSQPEHDDVRVYIRTKIYHFEPHLAKQNLVTPPYKINYGSVILWATLSLEGTSLLLSEMWPTSNSLVGLCLYTGSRESSPLNLSSHGVGRVFVTV